MLLTAMSISGGGRKQTKDGLWVRAASTEVPGTLKSWQNAKSEQRPVLVIIGMSSCATQNGAMCVLME